MDINNFLGFMFVVIMLSILIYSVAWAFGYTLNVLWTILVASLITALADITA